MSKKIFEIRLNKYVGKIVVLSPGREKVAITASNSKELMGKLDRLSPEKRQNLFFVGYVPDPKENWLL